MLTLVKCFQRPSVAIKSSWWTWKETTFGERSRTGSSLVDSTVSFDFPSHSGARSSQMFNHLVFVVHCVTKERKKMLDRQGKL
jgi:hypothetical protein